MRAISPARAQPDIGACSYQRAVINIRARAKRPLYMYKTGHRNEECLLREGETVGALYPGHTGAVDFLMIAGRVQYECVLNKIAFVAMAIATSPRLIV